MSLVKGIHHVSMKCLLNRKTLQLHQHRNIRQESHSAKVLWEKKLSFLKKDNILLFGDI